MSTPTQRGGRTQALVLSRNEYRHRFRTFRPFPPDVIVTQQEDFERVFDHQGIVNPGKIFEK